MKNKDVSPKKRPRKKNESQDSNKFETREVKLYLPSEYRERVLCDSLMSRLKEAASFSYNEVGQNVLRFTSNGKLDKLRSVVNIIEQAYRIVVDFDDDISERDIDTLFEEYFKNTNDEQYKYNKESIFEDAKGRFFTPRTENQIDLVDSIRRNTVTIVEGAAGTGKSRIALIMGLNMLKDNRVNKLIIIRPLVAVGGDIGFLPGGVDEKINPYQSPITEALVELIGKETYEEWIEAERIVLYPAAFARGCNISDAFVLVDEAQNFDEVTLLTLLTRICGNTKMVLTGDSTQDDRANKFRVPSGLSEVKKKLKGSDDRDYIDNVGIIEMGVGDVQRSKIVRDILGAYLK